MSKVKKLVDKVIETGRSWRKYRYDKIPVFFEWNEKENGSKTMCFPEDGTAYGSYLKVTKCAPASDVRPVMTKWQFAESGTMVNGILAPNKIVKSKYALKEVDADWLKNVEYFPGNCVTSNKEKSEDDPVVEISDEEREYFEAIYDFDCEGVEPTYEQWIEAGIALGYGNSPDDFSWDDYAFARGDYDYTRN